MSNNDNRPGKNARRKATPVTESPGAGFTPEERGLSRYIRTCYVVNRSAFQSAKEGLELIWAVPKSYDGIKKASNDPQDKKKKAKNVWYEMARWFLQRGIHAPSFIQYVFARLDISARIPEPAHICNEGYIPAFHKYVTEDAVHQISKAFEVETGVAESAYKSCRDAFNAFDPNGAAGKKWDISANVICNRSLPLSALFRYLLALSSAKGAGQEGSTEFQSRFLDLARRLFDQAAFQFCMHPKAYATHWARWLPKKFPDAAEARFRELAFNEEVQDEDSVV